MADDEVIKGLDAFTEQPVRRSKSQGEQWVTTREFRGPQHLVTSKEDELLLLNPLSISTTLGIPAVITIETEEGGGSSQQSQSDQGIRDQTSIDETVWELDWNRVETDLRDHSVMTYIKGSGNLYTDTVDAAIAKGTASAIDFDTLLGANGYNSYRDCKLKGITSFVEFQPIIRATVTASFSTQIQAPAVEAGKIIAWNQIALPIGSAVKTPPARIQQPTIHSKDANNQWQNVPINQWMVMPVRVQFVRSSKQYTYQFEWQGAVTYVGFLYDGGLGAPQT
jgi:hypothetical protein